jgi:hypothetical protein
MPTNWANITSIEGMLIQANSHAPFWTGMLLLIFAVFLISFLGMGFPLALMTAGLIGFVLGLFLTYMGLVSWTWTLMLLGIMLIGIIYSIWEKKD